MSNDLPKPLLPDVADITHPFKEGDRVKACIIPILRRPLFIRATISTPVEGTADLYWGRLDGDANQRRFFAHQVFQDHQAEAALRLHWMATLQPESFGLDFGYVIQNGGGRG